MRRFLLSIVAGVLALSVLSACGEIQVEHPSANEQQEDTAED